MEPYVPGEEPKEPDLSKIFPAATKAPKATATAMPGVPGQASAPTGVSRKPIQGTIAIAPELADRIPAGATLFLIARAGDAGPLAAVKKIESPKFPFEFSLGPEDSMVQARGFQGPMQLSARLDSDGNAGTRDPGDLQGRYPELVEPGAQSLELSLDELL